MATQFCEKCKQVHPGRVCDYDDKGECSETDVDESQKPGGEASKGAMGEEKSDAQKIP